MGVAHQCFSNPSLPRSLLELKRPAMNRFGDLDDLRELQATERWYIIHVCKRSSKSGKMEDSVFLQYLLGKSDEVSFLCLLDAVVEVHLGSPKGIPITKLRNTKKWGYNFYHLSYKQMVSYEVAKQISSQRKDIFNPMMHLNQLTKLLGHSCWVIFCRNGIPKVEPFGPWNFQTLEYQGWFTPWRPGRATSQMSATSKKTGS